MRAKFVLTIAFALLGLMSLSASASAQSITITSPAPGASVTVGPGSAALIVKFTVPVTDGFQPSNISLTYPSGGGYATVGTTNFSPDTSSPPGSGKFVAEVHGLPSGTFTGCIVTATAYKPGDSGGGLPVTITSSSGGITITKQ